MRTLKEIRQIAESFSNKKTDEKTGKKIPAVLVLRRKSVRQFPDGVVALYKADLIDKVVSIPFVKSGVAQLSETKKYKNNFERLNEIRTSGKMIISFKDGKSFDVNSYLAEEILDLYSNLNRENKKKLKQSLDESVDSFKKIVSFATRQ